MRDKRDNLTRYRIAPAGLGDIEPDANGDWVKEDEHTAVVTVLRAVEKAKTTRLKEIERQLKILQEEKAELLAAVLKYAEQAECRRTVTGSYGHLLCAHENAIETLKKITGKELEELLINCSNLKGL